MRKNLAVIFIICSIIMLSACGKTADTPAVSASPAAASEETESSEEVAVQSKGKIGVMISDMDDKFSLDIEKGIEDVLTEKGYEIILMDSKGVDVNDVLNMQDLLKEDIKGIVYNPISSTISLDIVRLAVVKEIPVVSVGKTVSEARVVSNVTTDYFSLGVETAKIISNKFGEDYVEMAEIPAINSTDETESYLSGFHSVIDTIYNFKVYKTVLLQGIEPTPELYVAEAIRHNSRIKALITTSDEAALTAIEVAKEKEFDCNNIAGLGGSDDAIEATNAGDMMVTYKIYPEKMGRAAANAIIDYLDGKTVAEEIFVDADVITSPTAYDVESTLEAQAG